jgi:transcriptional regulator with XRE-family HTH domain
MPDIGAALRDARMRARIDVSEIEAQTKIRAKYLRALENEEWDLLPGPTYVKSFLRTYAEALDLDAKLLVDEYKLRHERLSEVELQPINAAAPGRERRRQGPVIPRGVVFGLIIAGLLFALYLLDPKSDSTQQATPNPTVTRPATTPPVASVTPVRKRPQKVKLRIEATGSVYVCLKAGDRTLINGAELQQGESTAQYSSKRFRLTLGNNAVTLHVNGKARSVAPSPNPIGVEITPRRGRQPLPAGKRPVCK